MINGEGLKTSDDDITNKVRVPLKAAKTLTFGT
ncbi:MAG: hypothetical protein ACI84C_002605 [Flavobacteriales bacterium]|jgi:hypothetical protein